MSVNYVLEGILQMEVDAKNVPSQPSALPANQTILMFVLPAMMDIILMEEIVRLVLIQTVQNVLTEPTYVLNIEPLPTKLPLRLVMEQ